jgi:hypothetical protein
MPWNAWPRRSMEKAFAGAAEQRMLPRSMRSMEPWRAELRPKTSANWPQKGMNAAEVKLRAETIQLNWGG